MCRRLWQHATEPLQMLVTMLDYNDFVGRIGIGRISNGKIIKGQSVMLVRPEGNVPFRVTQLQGFFGLARRDIDFSEAGDIVLCGLMAWALWSLRSRRFGWVVWAGAMGLAILFGYHGQRGSVALRQVVEQIIPLGSPGWRMRRTVRSRTTAIGQIGQIKTSGEIVIRLKTPNGGAPPPYLREASYRVYNSAAWYAGSSKDDFSNVPETPQNSGNWPLVAGKTNGAELSIACYLSGGNAYALLPLPGDAGQLEKLPAYLLRKNSAGDVDAEGPGLVIFNALYGPTPSWTRLQTTAKT